MPTEIFRSNDFAHDLTPDLKPKTDLGTRVMKFMQLPIISPNIPENTAPAPVRDLRSPSRGAGDWAM